METIKEPSANHRRVRRNEETEVVNLRACCFFFLYFPLNYFTTYINELQFLDFVNQFEAVVLLYWNNIIMFLKNCLSFTTRINTLNPSVIPVWIYFLASHYYLSMLHGK